MSDKLCKNLRVYQMKRRSILTSTLLFALSISVTVGCSNPSTEIKPPTVPKAGAVKLAYSTWTGWLPWKVTQAKNIFQDNKVDVDLQWFDDYPKSVELVNSGKIDGNSQPLADIVKSVASGADLVVVLINDNSAGGDQIIINNKIKSIKDLKGKKVAAEPGAVDHFLLHQALKRAGMTFKDIKFVPLETSKAAAAFAAGEVDAVSVYAPFTNTALKRPGSTALFTSTNFPYTISDHLVFTRKFVNDHPEKVQAIVDSWFDTLAYINRSQNQAEVNDIMAKRAGMSVTDYKEDALGAKIFSVEDNIASFGTEYGDTSLANIAIEMSKFLFENGLTKTKVDTSKLFDDRFVKSYAARQAKAK
jgi:NitT/TauT family transport system substrate-binding protein